MTTVNPRRLSDALRACARGIHPLEAGTSMLIDCGSWLHREDFTSRFITVETSISDGATLLAVTDREAAVTALHAGELSASGGERRMLLMAASIAGGIPVSLCDTLPGIDHRNASLVIKAIAHATGQTHPRTGTPQRDSEPRADPRCSLPCPGTGATVNLGPPAVRSEVHLSGDTLND